MYYGWKLLHLALAVILFSACRKDVSEEGNAQFTGDVTIHFEHSVRNLPLTFTDEYTTDFSETYTVKTFRYYIHTIELINKAGVPVLLSGNYFLIDESDPSTKTLTFKAPQGVYSSVSFMLGVDSVDNVSGAQAGALDPAKGMFWTWSSGYVMAKLEGSSPFVTGASNNFTYHVGGFKSPYAVIKKITLPVPASYSLELKKDAGITISLNADINTWFSGVNPIKMALTPACHSPGDLAKKIADNYEGMFSVRNIE